MLVSASTALLNATAIFSRLIYYCICLYFWCCVKKTMAVANKVPPRANFLHTKEIMFNHCYWSQS
jgi:hypothetical protein